MVHHWYWTWSYERRGIASEAQSLEAWVGLTYRIQLHAASESHNT